MIKSQTVTFQSVEFRAVVSYATSPENFYVQLTPEDFFELFKRLNEHSIDSVDKKFWAYFHKPCLAPFNDGKCYQARIVAVSDTSATVHYFDYRIHFIVNTNDLRTLPVEFIEPPPPLQSDVVPK
jgi:hypothetical protein